MQQSPEPSAKTPPLRQGKRAIEHLGLATAGFVRSFTQCRVSRNRRLANLCRRTDTLPIWLGYFLSSGLPGRWSGTPTTTRPSVTPAGTSIRAPSCCTRRPGSCGWRRRRRCSSSRPGLGCGCQPIPNTSRGCRAGWRCAGCSCARTRPARDLTESEGTERIFPNSAAIGFSATTVISGAPREMQRMPSADQATSQERRVSIVPVRAASEKTISQRHANYPTLFAPHSRPVSVTMPVRANPAVPQGY